MCSKEIVIVGGGYGGAYLAFKLLSEEVGKVVLIEPKDCSLHCLAGLRTAVDKSFEKNLCIPFTGALARAHVRTKASALDIKNKIVYLENGEKRFYTDLVIATGTNSPFPGKLGYDNSIISKANILEKYNRFRKEILSSERVVIVGGGTVGIEFAGEVKTKFPNKQVTIITSSEKLATSRSSPELQSAIKDLLKQKEINLFLKERVINLYDLTLNKLISGQVVKTDEGKEIVCDLVVPCIGTKINNEFYKEALADAVNNYGALRVNELLQVEGHENIYAIGDVTDVDEEKMAKTAIEQAEVLFETLKGIPTFYKANDNLSMLIPVGRNNGIGQNNGIILKGNVVANYKSKDLFSERLWANLGVKPPN